MELYNDLNTVEISVGHFRVALSTNDDITIVICRSTGKVIVVDDAEKVALDFGTPPWEAIVEACQLAAVELSL